MVVEQPVFDNWGNLLLNKNNELTASLINNISEKGVSEVFIRDWRVTDVLVALLFPLRMKVSLPRLSGNWCWKIRIRRLSAPILSVR